MNYLDMHVREDSIPSDEHPQFLSEDQLRCCTAHSSISGVTVSQNTKASQQGKISNWNDGTSKGMKTSLYFSLS